MLAIALAAALISPADAKEITPEAVVASEDEAASDRSITRTASVGAGVGFSHGMVGASGELGFRLRSGFGASVELGAGLTPSATGRLWLVGSERARVGLDLTTSTVWSDLIVPQSSCMGFVGGDPSYHRTGILGAGVTVDHDVGASGGWAMRYGLGGGIVLAGCAGGILPNPTVALHYSF